MHAFISALYRYENPYYTWKLITFRSFAQRENKNNPYFHWKLWILKKVYNFKSFISNTELDWWAAKNLRHVNSQLQPCFKIFEFELRGTQGSVPVETYSRNWIWPRSIFIIGRVWPWNWYCTHINLNNVILWGIIPICKNFAKTWHCLFCFGARYSFWPFALTRECALHLRPCEKTRKTYFAGGLAGFSKTICTVPE